MFSASVACVEYSPTRDVVTLNSTFDNDDSAIVNLELYGPLLATPGSNVVWVSVTTFARTWVDVEPSFRFGESIHGWVAAKAEFDTADVATNIATPRAAKMRFRILPITLLGYPLRLRKSYEPSEKMPKALS